MTVFENVYKINQMSLGDLVGEEGEWGGATIM